MGIDPVSLAITAALTAGSMALQMTRKIEGPRLNDLSVTVADYGTPLPYFYGTRRFEGCPCFWAEPLKEVKKKQKTKGGKYSEYKYYGTWAIAIADHEIETVTRLWFDRHLVAQRKAKGAVAPAGPGLEGALLFVAEGKANKQRTNTALYLGTETQEPDPRMLATIEAEHGAGTCPAFRGVAYAVFKDAPLEKVGNRLPQVSIEAVTGSTPAYPFDTVSSPIPQPADLAAHSFTYSPDFSRFIHSYPVTGQYAMWDTASRSVMVSGTQPFTAIGFGLTNDGTIYGTGGFLGSTLYAFSPDGLFSTAAIALDFFSAGCRVVQSGAGQEVVCIYPYAGGDWIQTYTLGGVGGYSGSLTADLCGESFDVDFYFADSHGDIWVAGISSTTALHLFRIVDIGARPGSTGYVKITGLPVAGACAVTHYDGNFIVAWASSSGGSQPLYLIDDTTMAIVATGSYTPSPASTGKQFENLPPGSSSIWLNFREYSLADLSLIRSVDWLDWKNEQFGSAIYDPINHAIISAWSGTQDITWRYLDRVSGDGVTLRSIVEDVSTRVGIASADVDATDLTQTVPGYSWTQGAGKDIIGPLLDAYDSDARPHDFKVQFLQRGDSSGGTIETEYFARKGSEPRYTVEVANDTDLPRRVFFNFADLDHDQQTNAAVVQRPLDAADTRRELTIDMTTLALEADDALQMAERLFRRKWFARETITLGLTALNLSLEPADIRTLDLDGSQIISRMVRQTIGADGYMPTVWERDHPALNTLSGSVGAPMAGRVASTILVPGLSKGFVIDAPLFIDAHDQTTPFIYIAAAPYTDDVFWPGADFMHSDSGATDSYSAGFDAIPSTDAATWGYATAALNDSDAAVIDNGSGVNVMVKYGTLTSVTETEMLGNAALNLALLGDELIQFKTATLQGDGSYTLTGLIRGCRGTEWACGDHEIGDQFILLSVLIKKHSLGASEISDTDYYKVISQGREESSGVVETLAFTGAANKPYAPAHVTLTRDSGSGDWAIAWIRRTRIGGNRIDGEDVPIGETSESYEVDVLNGSTVVRTITAVTNSASYSAAQQTTDFGSPQSTLSVKVYQKSPALGLRGYVTAAAA